MMKRIVAIMLLLGIFSCAPAMNNNNLRIKLRKIHYGFKDDAWNVVWKDGLDDPQAPGLFANILLLLPDDIRKINELIVPEGKYVYGEDFTSLTLVTINPALLQFINESTLFTTDNKVDEYITLWQNVYEHYTTSINPPRIVLHKRDLLEDTLKIKNGFIDFITESDNPDAQKLCKIVQDRKIPTVPANTTNGQVLPPQTTHVPPTIEPTYSTMPVAAETLFGKKLREKLQTACPRVFNLYGKQQWSDSEIRPYLFNFTAHENLYAALYTITNEELDAINKVFKEYGYVWTKNGKNDGAIFFELKKLPTTIPNIDLSGQGGQSGSNGEGQGGAADEQTYGKFSLFALGTVGIIALGAALFFTGKKIYAFVITKRIDAQCNLLNALCKRADKKDAGIAAAYKAAVNRLSLVNKETRQEIKGLIDTQDYVSVSKLLKAEYNRLKQVRKRTLYI